LIVKTFFKLVAVPLVLASLLGGCAVYGPPPAYGYYEPAPVYVQPAPPVYVQPAPVYVAPPVSFGLHFGYWGGRHGWHR
jgi:hypothetical protein